MEFLVIVILKRKAIHITMLVLLLLVVWSVFQDSKTYYDAVSINVINQIVKTELYSLKIPKKWGIERLPDNRSFYFEANNKIISGIGVQPYYDHPISWYLPNHSRIISEQNLKNFPMETRAFYIEIQLPAIMKDPAKKYELHIFFDPKDKEHIYQLFFKLEHVDKDTAFTIAKSFKLLD